MNTVTKRSSIAVVGASGYVGRILTDHLAGPERRVIAIGRSQERLPIGPGIESKTLDIADREAAAQVLAGVDAAYYLVHAMADDDNFAERDKNNARSFAMAAQQAGVGRIIYLGGLGGDDTSDHLSSRHEVGQILRTTGIPVVELRAAVILGAGSISYEMLRYLTERLPAMVCPRWVNTSLQPLAERDLLTYLQQSLDVEPGTYEIGTPDVTNYHDMMLTYATIRGLRRRWIVKVPLLTPSLSAHWVDLMTPVDRLISHALIESLRNEVVVRDKAHTDAAFNVQPMSVVDAIGAALNGQITAMTSELFDRAEGHRDGVYTIRSVVNVEPERADAVRRDLARVGGDFKWYGVAWAWRLRHLLGRLFGEHLGLRGPEQPLIGAEADWWTIAHLDANSLVLASRSWFFGEGWLGYLVTPANPESLGTSQVIQVAAFRPRGIPGLLYWQILRPIHRPVFRSMARHRVARRDP